MRRIVLAICAAIGAHMLLSYFTFAQRIAFHISTFPVSWALLVGALAAMGVLGLGKD